MGKKPNDTDSASVRKDKKSKKNKNITSDIDVGVPKDKSHKHKEKKKKSESIEDGDEDRHDKGNLVNSGDLQKKDKKKKRKRDSSDPAQTEEDEPGHKDGSDLVKETDKKDRHDKGNLVNSGDLRKKDKKKKRKRDSSDPAQIEEDEPGHKDEEHGKGNLVNDGDLQKKDKKKKRKQNSSDTPQIQENESTQNEGPDLKRVSDRQSQSQNSRTEDMFEKNKNEKKKKKKKKKTDGQTTDTETNGIITEESNIKDSQDVKRKKGDGSEEKKKSIENNTEKPKAKRKSKYVSFSDQVEVFPEPKKKTPKTDGLIRGEGPDLKGVSDRQSQSQNSRAEDMVEKNKNEKKKKNKKKKTDGQTSDTETNGIITEESNIKDSQDVKRKKVDGSEEKKKSTESIEKNTEKPKAKRKSKKVSFSDQVDVFPEPKKKPPQTDGLIHGKRFTPEEDAIVKEAVFNYIKAHDLGDEGLNMVLNCKSYPGMKNVWREIGACIPYRPNAAIYQRGHTLFERGGKWTPEEIDLLKELHKEYGNKWKMMATELGKNRFHVKDMWRRVKFTNVNRGRWSREEYQNLYDLVNLDLQTKIHSEKKSKHGMLRDNIPWTTISEKLETRTDALCCMKWYRVLTSSLVAENKWCDADDYRMIGVLYELDATCAEDVDWDNVLEHRPGEVCRKRWDQMVKHIGHPGSKPFAEQVDILAKRYCPDMAETREAWDNKKVVD